MKHSAGRQAKRPFIPTMQRHTESQRPRISYDDAVQQLVSRVIESNITDADRLRHYGRALVVAKEEAKRALEKLQHIATAFAEHVQHYSPIAADACQRASTADYPLSNSDSIYRSIRSAILDKLPRNTIAMLLGRECECPLCGRKKAVTCSENS